MRAVTSSPVNARVDVTSVVPSVTRVLTERSTWRLEMSTDVRNASASGVATVVRQLPASLSHSYIPTGQRLVH